MISRGEGFPINMEKNAGFGGKTALHMFWRRGLNPSLNNVVEKMEEKTYANVGGRRQRKRRASRLTMRKGLKPSTATTGGGGAPGGLNKIFNWRKKERE